MTTITALRCLFAALAVFVPLAAGHTRERDSLHDITQQSSLAQLSFLGLPAERLLASGLSSAQILDAAQRLRDASSQLESLDSALQHLTTAQSALRALEAQVSTSDSSDSAAQALAAARESLSLIEAQVTALRASLRSLVLADMSADQRSQLARALAGARLGIDSPLALAAETEVARRQIAIAVQAESRSRRLGETLEPTHQQLLASARSQPQVVAASIRMDSEWSSLRQALSTPNGGGQP